MIVRQEVYKPRNVIISRLFSALVGFFWQLGKKTEKNLPVDYSSISNIVVLEYHCIGDVILITSALRTLRSSFPRARVTLVVNLKVSALADVAQLADTILPVDIPWVHKHGSISLWKKFYQNIRYLRRSSFDLGISFKGDFRDIAVLRYIKPTNRLGFLATGGEYFLTHVYSFPFEMHQAERAINLLQNFGLPPADATPLLQLPALRPPTGKIDKYQIVLHPGASHPLRYWSQQHWLELIAQIHNRYSLALVELPETKNLTDNVKSLYNDIEYFSGSLLEFATWLSPKQLLIGLDSMAVHLATALGVPALAIFGAQNPTLTKPIGTHGHFIAPRVTCNHKRKDWRLCDKCINSITPVSVIGKIEAILPSKSIK